MIKLTFLNNYLKTLNRKLFKMFKTFVFIDKPNYPHKGFNSERQFYNCNDKKRLSDK